MGKEIRKVSKGKVMFGMFVCFVILFVLPPIGLLWLMLDDKYDEPKKIFHYEEYGYVMSVNMESKLALFQGLEDTENAYLFEATRELNGQWKFSIVGRHRLYSIYDLGERTNNNEISTKIRKLTQPIELKESVNIMLEKAYNEYLEKRI